MTSNYWRGPTALGPVVGAAVIASLLGLYAWLTPGKTSANDNNDDGSPPAQSNSALPTQCFVYWDVENIACPQGIHIDTFASAIQRICHDRYGIVGDMRAYVAQGHLSGEVREMLQRAAVSLEEFAGPRRPNACDMRICLDMLETSYTHFMRCESICMVLISNDGDFCGVIQRMKRLGIRCVVIVRDDQNASNSLLRIATEYVRIGDVLRYCGKSSLGVSGAAESYTASGDEDDREFGDDESQVDYSESQLDCRRDDVLQAVAELHASCGGGKIYKAALIKHLMTRASLSRSDANAVYRHSVVSGDLEEYSDVKRPTTTLIRVLVGYDDADEGGEPAQIDAIEDHAAPVTITNQVAMKLAKVIHPKYYPGYTYTKLKAAYEVEYHTSLTNDLGVAGTEDAAVKDALKNSEDVGIRAIEVAPGKWRFRAARR